MKKYYTFKNILGLSVLILITLIISVSLAATGNEGVFSEVTITPDPIKLGSTTYIQYTISNSSNVSINITSEDGTLVKTLLNNVSKTAGSYSQSWDGKDSNGILVNDGNYTITLIAKDTVGNIIGQVEKSVIAAKVPGITNVNDTNDPFNPINNENCTINYTLNNNAKVTVTIMNGYTPVRTLESGILKSAGSYSIIWDGKDDLGNFAGDNTYTYQIDAVSPLVSYFKSNVKSTITLDKEAPQISNLFINPDPLKLITNNLTISYNLSENSKVTLKILDSQGNIVQTLLNNVVKNSGYNNISWNGKDASGNYVPEGLYTISINAIDNLNKPSEEQTKTFTAGYVPIISNVGDAPDPFNPGIGEQSSINYSISNDALVTITIMNGYIPVRTLSANLLKSQGTYSVVWDGKDDAGNLVSDAVYTYQIDAVSPTVAIFKSTFKGTVATDRGAPQITDYTVSPDPFKISYNNLTISYILSESSKVTMKILDSNGNIVQTILNGITKNAGYNFVTWNGRDSNGNYVPEGIYTLSLEAFDNFNRSSGEQIKTVTAGNLPSITGATILNNPFNPINGEFTEIFYTIPKDALVTVTIFKGYTPIRTLQNNTLKIAGSYSVTWDGKNDSGNLASDGDYTYQIEAVSPTVPSFKSTYKGTVSLDASYPTITDLNISPNPVKITNNTTFRYTLSEPATVTVQVLNSQGLVIKDFPATFKTSSGNYSIIWDTKNNLGNLIAGGDYILKITAIDNNNKSSSEAVFFTAIAPPDITDVFASPQTIDFKVNTGTNLSFTVSEKSFITLNIYNPNGQLWRNLLKNVDVTGTYTITWDGRSDEGRINPGTFTYKIDAVSTLSNLKAQTVDGNISIINVSDYLSKSCTECHNNYPISHPVTNCDGCHGDDQPVQNCIRCHTEWPVHVNGSVLTTYECTHCHNYTFSYKIPIHPENLDAAHNTSRDMTTCNECHQTSLINEHSLRNDPITKEPYNCDTCHKSTKLQVIEAISTHNTDCAKCHGNTDHEVIHTTNLSIECQECHSKYLSTEHKNRGLQCLVCHESTNSKYTQAILWHRKACSECHTTGHGVNFVNSTPENIPKYSPTGEQLEWMNPQTLAYWQGESWIPSDMVDGNITMSIRSSTLIATEVYNYYTTQMLALGWSPVDVPELTGDKFQLVYANENKKVYIRFYKTERYNTTTTTSPETAKIEILYK